jgi:hypothetical protein
MKRKAKEKGSWWFEVCSEKIKRIEGLPRSLSSLDVRRLGSVGVGGFGHTKRKSEGGVAEL